MPNYCVLSQIKITSLPQMNALFAHNARHYTPRNCNPEEHYLNEFMLTTKSYQELFEALMAKYHVKQKSNSVLALEYTSKFTPGARIDLNQWKEQNRKFFEDTFGKENVLSMIVHYDEHTPHIHTLVVPLVKQIKRYKDGTEKEYYALNAKKYTGGKVAMQQLQTAYAAYMEPFGLKKGKKVKQDKARYEDISKFYQEITRSANLTLPKPRDMETVEEYIERVTPALREESMNYQRILRKWKKELHEKEVVLEKYETLLAWAESLQNDRLLFLLTELSEEELTEALKRQTERSVFTQ